MLAYHLPYFLHADPREAPYDSEEFWHLGALPVTNWLPQHVQGVP